MTENGLVPLHIQRIAIIHDDGSMNTHALLPEQIIPYSRFILPVIFQLIKAFRLSELHRPLADQTIDQLASQYSMFQETIYRLKRRYTIIWEPVLDQIHHWHENSWLDISKKILNNCHKQLMQATKRSICAIFSFQHSLSSFPALFNYNGLVFCFSSDFYDKLLNLVQDK